MLGDHPNERLITMASLLLDRLISVGQRLTVCGQEDSQDLLAETKPIFLELGDLSTRFENSEKINADLSELSEELVALAKTRPVSRADFKCRVCGEHLVDSSGFPVLEPTSEKFCAKCLSVIYPSLSRLRSKDRLSIYLI